MERCLVAAWAELRRCSCFISPTARRISCSASSTFRLLSSICDLTASSRERHLGCHGTLYRTQRPRQVRLPRTYSTWGAGGQPPCASGTYPTREAGARSPYVPYGGPGRTCRLRAPRGRLRVRQPKDRLLIDLVRRTVRVTPAAAQLQGCYSSELQARLFLDLGSNRLAPVGALPDLGIAARAALVGTAPFVRRPRGHQRPVRHVGRALGTAGQGIAGSVRRVALARLKQRGVKAGLAKL